MIRQAEKISSLGKDISWNQRDIKTCPCGQQHLQHATQRHVQNHMEGVKYQCPVNGQWYFIEIMPVSFS